MPDTTLASCPFCGSDAAKITNDKGSYEVGCTHCGTYIGCYSSERSAAANWNRRAVPAADPWRQAVDDQLVGYMTTTQDFATPKEAVDWLVKTTGEAAIACMGGVPAAAPEGWVMVPKEPTEEMAYRGGEATAGRIEWDDAPDDAPDELARAIYRAMLRNAPASPAAAAVTMTDERAAFLVSRQAEDAALWCQAVTPMEDMLQRALRQLHAAVEGNAGVKCPRCGASTAEACNERGCFALEGNAGLDLPHAPPDVPFMTTDESATALERRNPKDATNDGVADTFADPTGTFADKPKWQCPQYGLSFAGDHECTSDGVKGTQ